MIDYGRQNAAGCGSLQCTHRLRWFAAAVALQAEAQQAESVDVINEWAARVTKGLIKMAVPPGTPFDLVLTNAVYFKVGERIRPLSIDGNSNPVFSTCH